jgi:hypothetical protein
MKRIILAAGMLVSVLSAAQAQQGTTVADLLKDGYEIKAVFPSNAGPGLVLQKGADAMMCFVAETPKSADVATQYCKPVH